LSIPDKPGQLHRRLPLLIPSLGWLIGLAIARTDCIPFELVAAVVLLITAALIFRYQRAFAVATLAGLVWGSAFLFLDAYRVVYDASWVDQRLALSGTVEDVVSGTASTRLRLHKVVRDDGAELSGKIDIYIYGLSAQLALVAGQRVSAEVRLHPPSNRLNPGAFDYRGYCFDRHIALIGSADKVRVIDDERSWLQRIRKQIIDRLPERRESGVIRALLLADRSGIPVEVQDAFAASGAAHLLAISGLHVGMVAGWTFLLAWWLLTRREAWIIAVPVRKVSLLCGLLAAICYATLAGWPIPAQRSVLMLAAAVLAWWLRNRAEPLNTMLAALILVLLLDPAAITSVSLWLSFAAVISLLLWAEGGWMDGPVYARAINRWQLLQRWATGLFMVSLVASLATLPIITDLFGRIPTWSLVVNLVLVPLYSLIILPLTLVGELLSVTGIGSMAWQCFDLADSVIGFGNVVLITIQGWPGGNLWVADVPLWTGIIYAAGLALALRLQLQKRLSASLAVATVSLCGYLFLVVPERFPDVPKLTVWDVGQGAASTLLMPDGDVMAIDLPGRFNSRYNGGSDVSAGLRSMGITHADVLVLTHAQSDHAGGAGRFIASLRDVRELWLADVPANHHYLPMKAAVELVVQQGGIVRWLKQGDRIVRKGTVTEVLWPPTGYQPPNGNNASLVLSVTLQSGAGILFSADSEVEVERSLSGHLHHHDLVLMPHHGSRTSSSESWIRSVSPRIAIAQTGMGNRYGFPADEVIERYQMQGSQLFDSKYGAVSVTFSGDSDFDMHVGQYRPQENLKRDVALQWLIRSL